MKIEVLYFDGCPNHGPAVQLVRDVLAEQRLSATISEVKVHDSADAQKVGFLGSPSIRVNGIDIEPPARSLRDYGMMCRTYAVNGRREGIPSREMVRQAVLEARSEPKPAGPESRAASASWFAAGSVLAAVVASFCCILPIVFALAGASILGASALFDSLRPYLLGLTFGLLGLGYFLSYRPGKPTCEPGSACAMPATRRSGRLLLWLATAAVVLFAAFPYYSGAVAKLVLR